MSDPELDRLQTAQDLAFQRKQRAYDDLKRARDHLANVRDTMSRAFEAKQRAQSVQSAAWQDYQRVKSTHGSYIDQLNDRQQRAHNAMQAAFDRASAAHASHNGAAARQHSLQGHQLRAERDAYRAERPRHVAAIREARARLDATKPALERAKTDFTAAKQQFDREKGSVDTARSAFERAKTDFDRAATAFKARLQKAKAESQRRKSDKRSIADRAGIPLQYRNNVKISRQADGTINIYFGGVGRPNGPGHGHYVMDASGTVTYRREPSATYGAQNFADDTQRPGSPYPWSNRGANSGLTAGVKRDPSGDGNGQWWHNGDASGQDQSRRNADGSVTYWSHERVSGEEWITEITYGADGTETSRDRWRKR